ncbi:phosphatidylglycerophosphatase A [bacterium]|nr:phosphatidylglycerophosphatase A [bacterium]
MKKHVITFFGSFFYTGFFPFAPATFATLIWAVCYLFIPPVGWIFHLIALIVMLPVSIYIAEVMEGYFGHDASVIVIDEFVGMQVTFFAIAPSPLTVLIGFLLFRIFDIAKPFPIDKSQRIKGGYGVVVDDVIAGLYSYIILKVIMKYSNLI